MFLILYMAEKSILAPGRTLKTQVECVWCVMGVVQFLVWTDGLPSQDVRNAAVEIGVMTLQSELSTS